MTYKTAKITKLTLLLLVSTIVTTSAFAFTQVSAKAVESETRDGIYVVTQGNGIGKNILKYGQAKIIHPEATELFAISAKLSSPDAKYSEEERQIMRDRIDLLQEQLYAKVPQLSAEKEASLENQREIFRDYQTGKMADKTELQEFRDSLPFIGLSIDREEQAVKFGFPEENLTDENVKNYFKQIREIIGDDINVVITSQEQPKPIACATQSSDCSPLVGGIRIQVNLSPFISEECSIGFKADRLEGTIHKKGFITAGHCSDGSASPNLNVEQATSPDVGLLELESLKANSECDCAWVEANAGITVDDSVFGGAEPNSVAAATVNTAVTAKSYPSLTMTGIIAAANYDYWWTDADEGSIFMRNQLVVDFAGVNGDSGGIVYKTSGSGLIGIMTTADSSNTYLSSAGKLSYLSSAVTWDFT